MRRILFIVLLFTSVKLSSQNSVLYDSDFRFGFDVGYSVEGYLPMSLYFGKDKMVYGFTLGSPVGTGQKGEYFSNINWDEYPEDIVNSGSFYYPFTVDIGYSISEHFIIGGGLGYAVRLNYRNMYDDFHILGDNGSYHITVTDGGVPEIKVFGQYIFPSESYIKVYIKGFYSNNMGPGGAIGFEL